MTYEVENVRTYVRTRPYMTAFSTTFYQIYVFRLVVTAIFYIVHVTKLWDHVGNPLYISTTKFGDPNLMARYILRGPKIAENRKISNFKGSCYLILI